MIDIPLLPANTLTRPAETVSVAHEITSPPVRYTGSKWNISRWVIKHFPKHTCYVEPFCGGAAVLFRKQPSPVEVINDVELEVINFFRVLREHTQDFMQAIALTPYSRLELKLAHEPTDNPVEKARRFYIRSRQKFAGSAEGHEGAWRYRNVDAQSPLKQWLHQDHLRLAVERLRHVYVECDDAFKVFPRFDSPETLFFCDPPYVDSTRTEKIVYTNEMSDVDHRRLAETLHSIKGMALISGYDCPLYRELYADWQMVTIEAYSVKRIARTECLWISPSAQAKQAQRRLL